MPSEFLVCGMYPLLASFGFKKITDGTTAVSRVVVHLLVFHVELVSAESANRFLMKVETDAE
jgi:hypothetical protein